MTDQDFDRLLARLERDATPEPVFADRLFSQLAVDAGFGRRRRFADAFPRWSRLAWLAASIAALLLLMSALLLSGGAPRPRIVGLVVPSPEPAATSDASPAPSNEVSPLRPSSGVLDVGAPAPFWTGRLLDGGAFSTADLLGRPSALLLWCTCVSGDQARVFLEEAKRREDVAMVLVSMDGKGTTQGLVDLADSQTPVVQDDRFELLTAWDLSFYPALVLLRADGTVADLQPMTFDAASLTGIVDSLATGGVVPEPTPFPSPPAEVEGGGLPLSTVLQVGEPAPELVGPRLGGGELSTHDLLGRPTVVLHWVPPHLDGAPQDDEPPPDALLDAVAARGDAMNIVLIARGEPEPGAAAAYLEAEGADVPVVFDWDGTLHERWGLVMFNTLVLLDDKGRVAGYYRASALIDPAPLLDSLIAGNPLPSPDTLPP
jgi:hypothetical protein